MDVTLLCRDDQKPSPPALTHSQTEDLDPHYTTENMSAYETETEVDLFSDTSSKSAESLSNVSKCLSQERSPDSDCPKPSSSGCNMSECLPICSELTPKNDDFRVCSYFGSSEPALPLSPSTADHISPLSESFSEFYVKQEPALTFSLIQKNSTPEPFGHTSSTSEVSTASVTELLSTTDNSQATYLLRSLWHQSDSLESDTAMAPVSDLYIYESETQDFILSSNEDPSEIQCPEYQPSSQMGVNMADPNCDNHVLMCDSEKVVTQWHRGSSEEPTIVDYESGVSQHARLRPPALDSCEEGSMSVNDGRQTEVTDLTTQPRRSDSPIELWLDACQYLAGEDTEDREVSDKTGHSVMQGGLTSDLSFPPGETQESGYNLGSSEGIGWSSEDTRGWGPPVQRWSSVDSWASALSDWTGIIAAPLEDFTAAFTEIGAEIDALTQALAEVNTHTETDASTGGEGQEPAAQEQPAMGVQDQPLSQNIPESAILSGQSCVYLCLEATGSTLRDQEGSQSIESLCDSAVTTQEEKEPEEIQNSQTELSLHPTHQHLSPGSSDGAVASPGGYGVHVIPDLDLSHLGGFVESDIFISNEEDPIILNIIEDTDLEGQNTSGELITEELFGDKVCEVTDGHSVSQLGSAAEQEVKTGGGPPEVDPEGPEPATDPSFLTTHSLTNSHVPGVLTQPDTHINVQTCVSSHTRPDLDGERQVEPERGSPQYIMPIAPLSSLGCQTSTSLEGDQTCAERSLNDNIDPSSDHVQSCILGSTVDKTSLQGDELIHEKENATKFTGKSSPEGQVDLVPARKPLTIEEIHKLGRELSNLADVPEEHFFVSEQDRVAFITLDLNDPFAFRATNPITTSFELSQKTAEKMSHKTHKSTTSESKARSKKDKTAGHHHHPVQVSKKQENSAHPFSTQQVCKQQETCPLTGDNHTSERTQLKLNDKEAKLVIETSVATEKAPNKPHGKKKKKHAPNAAGGKSVGEPLVEVENGAKPKTAKGRIDMFEAKLGVKAGNAQKDTDQLDEKKFQHPEAKAKASPREQPPHPADRKEHQPKSLTCPLNDDIIKRRRLSADKFGKMVSALESKLPKPDLIQAKAEEPKADTGATRKKAYSEVVKQKTPCKEDPRVVQPVQAVSVSGDPQSLCLWCQFGSIFSDYTVTWSRGETVLSEEKRSAGDESRVSLTISNASHKDLGKYQCRLTSLHGSVTLDYLLTYEVLSEIVIPPSPKILSSVPVEVGCEEEDVHCSRLIFKEDFLSDQCFGDDQPVSILTEKLHFGEGMHRRAFRTKLQAGQIPLLLPGHACVLKVHNSISYGTKNNNELIQKNFNLAVEECHVQNTAREYIKAYTTEAQAVESFGEIPEIIPIYLVHRPSNDVPYATLEEELIGDFVKYSVKDGKEINLMRRDSEAGQKCCAFQHWVYQKTEGNLLVTDMQGVGMRLTDVGIATCKKGYKGFKGNCATSFIDQFKALHQCNTYCEVLGLKSLQPKPKKTASAPKPKAQISAAPKKKTFGPTVKGKW